MLQRRLALVDITRGWKKDGEKCLKKCFFDIEFKIRNTNPWCLFVNDQVIFAESYKKCLSEKLFITLKAIENFKNNKLDNYSPIVSKEEFFCKKHFAEMRDEPDRELIKEYISSTAYHFWAIEDKNNLSKEDVNFIVCGFFLIDHLTQRLAQ